MVMKEYESSADFTGDLFELEAAIKKANSIITKPEFADWIAKTQTNYGGNFVGPFNELLTGIVKAKEGSDNMVQTICALDE